MASPQTHVVAPPAFVIGISALADTKALAAAAAELAVTGDVIALAGALGSGKTTFARAFIRALGGTEEIPSPTFNLVQVYDLPGVSVWHFDLYRLAAPRDGIELGLDEALADGISLIEWPEHLGELLPDDRLDIALEEPADAPRRAGLTGRGSWSGRMATLAAQMGR